MRNTLLLLIGILSFGFSEDFTWKKSQSGFYESEIKTIAVDRHNPSILFAGSSRAVYRSEDTGKHYHRILSLRAGDGAVNYIYISPQEPQQMYVATDGGLYASHDGGKRWEKIYNSSSSAGTQCRSVFATDEAIYLGTLKGALYKSFNENHWHNMPGELDHEPVYQIIGDQDHVFCLTGHDLYRLDKESQSLKKILNEGFGEGKNLEDLPTEKENIIEGATERSLKFISITNTSPGYLVIASTRGFYFSADHGENWKAIDSDNIPLNELNSFFVLENNAGSTEQCLKDKDFCSDILAGTNRGAFLYKQGIWSPVYRGMETNRINDVSHDAQNTVYAATDKGIFSLKVEQALPSRFEHIVYPPTIKDEEMAKESRVVPQDYAEVSRYFSYEPSINTVQSLATLYAEVHPKKIEDWRQAARRKALLPNFSVGANRGATELFHWDTGGNPDNLQKGRQYVDWDMSLSWNLSELVWNNDQTSIDSRSKLMVELRDDILDEVTRIYFERRRMQLELLTANDDDELQLKIEKQMRIAELTALIDALTGGKFSQKIDENSHGRSGRL